MSPLRALLAAQAQSTWNRLQREAGEASVVAAALVLLLAGAAVAPPAWACFIVGRSFGRALAGGDSVASGVTAFQSLILGSAALSGLVGQRLSFSVSGSRLYPVPRLPLLGAELVAGLLDLLPLLGGLCCVALALGLSVGAPPATPLFLLVAAQQLLWIALLEHAVGVAKRVLAGSRLAMAALALAAVALAACLLPDADHGFAQSMRAVVGSAAAALQLPPFSQAYRGAEELLRGDAATGWARQLVLLAASTLLFAAVAAAHFGTVELAGRARGRGSERPWAPAGPVLSLARVFEGQVMASREGRTAFYLPLVVSVCLALATVAMGDLRGRAGADRLPWAVGMIDASLGLPLVGIFLAVLPTMDELWLNQFGHDGPAVRGLLLLPVRPEQVLLARTLGLARMSASRGAVALAPLVVACRPPLPEVTWGLAASGVVFLVVAACGHLVSARLPRHIQDGAFLGSRATPLTALLIPSAIQLPTWAVLVLTYKAAAPLGPWGPALAMGLLLAAAAYAYARLLPFLAARVMALREHLVEM